MAAEADVSVSQENIILVYSSRRASIVAFSRSLISPPLANDSLSSSFGLARIYCRSSTLSLGKASRISTSIMAEIYRDQRRGSKHAFGKTRSAIPSSALPVRAGPLTFTCENKVSEPLRFISG